MPDSGEVKKVTRSETAAELILSGAHEKISEFFACEGMKAPSFVWNPDPETLPHPLHRQFLENWCAMPRHGGHALPVAKEFDVFTFREAVGYLMYLDVIDGGRDFRYRVYGSKIAKFSGFDLTGKALGYTDTPSISRDFMIAGYKALTRRQEPLFTQHHSPRDFLVATWSRLLVPLIDESGATVRILGINIPSGDRPLDTGVRSVFS